jgi:RNA polymerase sigma factor (sigma-70 family)
MDVHVSYKSGKTSEVEREFEIQIRKLERRLRVFKPDLVHLHAIVDAGNRHGPSASLNLRLPSGQMAVQKTVEIGESVLAAVKAAFTDLLSQLTRHKDLLRGQWTRRLARPARAQAVQAAAAPVQTPVSASRRKRQAGAEASVAGAAHDLDGWVSANMAALKAFIDRELQIRVGSSQIREDQISIEEVVDEVMLSALTQENGRWQLLSPESWFRRQAIAAIGRLTRDSADMANVSLDAPARAQNVSGSDENLLQYHQPDDQPPEEAVIRDAGVPTPEEIYASEEMVAQLDHVLREVKAQDREAFILYTLEGFTVDEIARLSDRPPDQVRKSIHHARERVQQKLPERNEFRRSLLHRSRVA